MTLTKEELDQAERLVAKLGIVGLDRLEMATLSSGLPGLIAAARRAVELEDAWRSTPPHDLVLHCPACGKQHLDIGEFETRVHRKHLCEHTPEGEKTGCGHLWVPYPYATRGVLRPLVETQKLFEAAMELVAEYEAQWGTENLAKKWGLVDERKRLATLFGEER